MTLNCQTIIIINISNIIVVIIMNILKYKKMPKIKSYFLCSFNNFFNYKFINKTINNFLIIHFFIINCS